MMPLHWTISDSQRLVIAVARDAVTSRELFEYMSALQEAGAFSYRKIFDVTHLTGSLDDRVLRSLGSMVQQHAALRPLGPIAIVAASDEMLAKATTYAAAAAADRPIRIFRELHEARQWLDGL